MALKLEALAAFKHRQLLAEMGQVWVKMGMGKTINAKL